MTDASGGTCLAQETKPCRFVTQVPFANDLQGHRTTQVNVKRLVGDAHGSTAQLDWSAIVVQDYFIVFESANPRPNVSLLGASCS
jgi:hypothetical protein